MVRIFFNNTEASNEQTLLEDLVIESISQLGVDMIYIPRQVINKDEILNEPTTATFTEVYQSEFYVKDTGGYSGAMTNLIGNFAPHLINDQLIVTVARRTFENDVGKPAVLARPREGDLVWIPFIKKAFEIKFVNHEPYFYQLGSLNMYDLTLGLFEWNNETFNTRIPELDDKYSVFNTDMESYNLLDFDGRRLTDTSGNPLVQAEYNVDTILSTPDGEDIQEESQEILDWTDTNPFGQV